MQDESTDKKLNILDAAENLFSRNGFDATSTRDIADKAGVNVAMISYYFGSKENLLLAIIERFSTEILSELKDSFNENDPVGDRLKKLIDSYLTFSFNHPDPIIIAHRELGVNMRPVLRSVIQVTYSQARDLVNRIITDGQQAGIYRQVDQTLLIMAIGNMVDNMVIELHTFKRADVDLCAFNLMDIGNEDSLNKVKDFVLEITERFLKVDNQL